jgi:hypothetical protein
LASSGNQELELEDPIPTGSGLRASASSRSIAVFGAFHSEGAARWLFIWPTVLLVLFLSLFPLIASLALSLSRLSFQQGGVVLQFVGFSNYAQELFGLERSHFLGVLKSPSPLGWLIVGATGASGRSGSRSGSWAASCSSGSSGSSSRRS